MANLEKIEQLKKLLEEIVKESERIESLKTVYSIKPKFSVGQKAYILEKDYIPSWYKMPVLAKSLEEGIEEIEIDKICIGKKKNLGYAGCGCEEKEDEIGVAYEFGWDNCLSEKSIFATKSELVKLNQKKFNEEKNRFEKEREQKRKQQKKEDWQH